MSDAYFWCKAMCAHLTDYMQASEPVTLHQRVAVLLHQEGVPVTTAWKQFL